MLRVNLSFGASEVKFSNAAIKSVGIVSFDPNPYLPPIIIGAFSLP